MFFSKIAVALMAIAPVLAADSTSTATASSSSSSTITCSSSDQCPESAPCCSQYGECGVGMNCLLGCDIRGSYNESACVPAPVCVSKTWSFEDSDIIGDQFTYLGNASEYDWVTNNLVKTYDNTTILIMEKNSYGTVVTSTHSVWYGKISATMKSSYGQGVVSSFILFGGSKDEIDYEFVGKDLETVQTNFYFEGINNWTNSRNISMSDDTNETWHTYTIDWTEDQIEWSVDGEVGRTLLKSDTYNETTGEYEYPQTPCNVQLSLWPGGASSNAEGTIAWAGGAIDWDMSAFDDPGYLYVQLKELTVECYDPPSDAIISGNTSYAYNSSSSVLQSNVEITDDRTYLGSFEAVGWDMDKGKNNSSAKTASTGTQTAAIGGNGDRTTSANHTAATVTGVVINSTTVAVVSGSTITTVVQITSSATADVVTGSAIESTASGDSAATGSSSSNTATGFNQFGTTTSSEAGSPQQMVGGVLAFVATVFSFVLLI